MRVEGEECCANVINKIKTEKFIFVMVEECKRSSIFFDSLLIEKENLKFKVIELFSSSLCKIDGRSGRKNSIESVNKPNPSSPIVPRENKKEKNYPHR